MHFGRCLFWLRTLSCLGLSAWPIFLLFTVIWSSSSFCLGKRLIKSLSAPPCVAVHTNSRLHISPCHIGCKESGWLFLLFWLLLPLLPPGFLLHGDSGLCFVCELCTLLDGEYPSTQLQLLFGGLSLTSSTH